LRILLTAEDEAALLPTVRSRCQRLWIAPPSQEQAVAWLDAQGVQDPDVMLGAAGGQPQGALALHAEGIDAPAWSALPLAVRRGQAQGLAAWPLPRLVQALQRLCHDLLAQRVGGPARYFSPTALRPALEPEPPPLAALLAWQRALQQAARHADHPWNAPLRVEALVLEASALWQTARAPSSGRGGPLATLPGR
jgi:DNA polymerase-3 subunit delta'